VTKRMGLVGNATRVEEMINVNRISVGNTEGNRSLGRHTRKWEDRINVDPKSPWCRMVDCRVRWGETTSLNSCH
jgi:hypothetical protein